MSTRSESRPASPATMRLKRIRDVAELHVHSAIDRAVEVAQIAAPTNDEHERSRFVSASLSQTGHASVTVDEIGDVVTRIPGKDRSRAVLLAAHLDTVFPRGTPVEIIRSNGRISGPGIGDNSLGVASVMSILESLEEQGETPAVDLL